MRKCVVNDINNNAGHSNSWCIRTLETGRKANAGECRQSKLKF